MPFMQIFPDIYQLNSGPVNLWLVEDKGELTLIDTNYVGREEEILAGVRGLDKDPARIRNILLTHAHPDHAGSLAALKKTTGAQAWIHAGDAGVVRGQEKLSMSPDKVSPGLINFILFNVFIKNSSPVYPQAEIEHEIRDGQVLPCGGGIRAVHAPGHSAGHTTFLVPKAGGILILGDACSNMAGLDYSIVYDDRPQARRSLQMLAGLEFAGVCFSHGKELKGKDTQKFKHKWG